MNYRPVTSTLLCLALFATPAAGDNFVDQRRHMIDVIAADYADTSTHFEKERLSEEVLAVMNRVPRHRFVPPEKVPQAYQNRPLPIGYGQTISQPYIVALMTDLLAPRPGDRVLEIGTGSGYQAAVLAELVADVYSIEIVEPLGERTSKLLRELGYDNIHTRIADGYDGWPQQAPFDGIIVTAAISHIPPPLVKQLKPGGRMVIPVGTRFQVQFLTLVQKDAAGRVSTRQLLPVAFVPFTGDH